MAQGGEFVSDFSREMGEVTAAVPASFSLVCVRRLTARREADQKGVKTLFLKFKFCYLNSSLKKKKTMKGYFFSYF